MSRFADVTVAQALWDHMPLGVMVIDDAGAVRIVNERALHMTGYDSVDDVEGRSVVDFVVADDMEFVAAGLTGARELDGLVLGPIQIRYRTRSGVVRWSECWAYEAPAEVGFAGHVVTLSAESVPDRLAAVTDGIATGVDLGTTLEHAAASLEAFPTVATAVVLTLDDHDVASCSGRWPLPFPAAAGSSVTPWVQCARTGRAIDATVDDLRSAWAREADTCGFRSVWVRPIDVDGVRRAVLVAWRRSRLEPTPNQRRHIDQVVHVARLAFSHHDHRTRLDDAAFRDHLTGLGNRACLDRDLAAGTVPGAAMYLDLDDFKHINDRFGHHAGDDVLRMTAHRLEAILDGSDRVYRVGGDEFIVLCHDDEASHRTLGDLKLLADRMIESVGRPIALDGDQVSVGASIGVATRSHRRDSSADLLRDADERLLTAKRLGKLQSRVHDGCAAHVPVATP